MRIVKIPTKPIAIKPKRTVLKTFTIILIVFISFSAVLYFRPLPEVEVQYSLPKVPPPKAVQLDWPSTGQASLSVKNFSFTLTNTHPTQIPTASIAKMITVLCVLEKNPMKIGQSGPIIQMTAADIERLNIENNRNGSHLDIVEGEKLTQYQALEAILLPSANNIADSLAVWSFGSIDNYTRYAQKFVERNGMIHTTIGKDASGFDIGTTSTTADLAILAKLALANPVVMKIAYEKSATFETAGTVFNHNRLLDGGVLTGLKTGLNDGNTGSFLFSARKNNIEVVGAILDAGSIQNALNASETLAKSSFNNFEQIKYIAKNQKIGKITTAWGETSDIIMSKNLEVTRWKGDKIYTATKNAENIDLTSNVAGYVYLRTDGDKDEAKTMIKTPLKGPTVWWRLSHLR